jgi:hypothetical protein
MKTIIISVLFVTCFAANSGELNFNFNSPAFGGIGYSSHILTIKQLEDQAKDKNTAASEALKAKIEAAAKDTPQARFIANLESRIYSQLAKQLTDSMFGEGATCTQAGIVCGTIPDLGGNSITWKLGDGSDRGMIIISIISLTNANQVTTMKVPAGTFAF